MHSYLFVGSDIDKVHSEVVKFSQSNQAKLIDFDISTIEQVRELKHYVSLSQNEKQILYLPLINKASEAAQNALLKTIEEPSSKIMFVLTADNEEQVLATVRSRCEIMRFQYTPSVESEEVFSNYYKLTLGEKLKMLSKITDRAEAITFLKQIISGGSLKLIDNPEIYPILETAQEVLNRIEGNGNVQTQLTYFVSKDLLERPQ